MSRKLNFLVIATDTGGNLKNIQEDEIIRELLDETEELLQFGSWTLDDKSGRVVWTSGLRTVLGYPDGPVAGMDSIEFFLGHVTDDCREPLQEAIEQALAHKTGFSQEFSVRTRAGELKQISAKGRVVVDPLDGSVKLLCINRDVTALRNFEREQERSINELNRSNRDLEEFAYVASHDLQEPLRKISMFSERLKSKYGDSLDQEGSLFISRILASAANMRTLIENLLDFSRVNRRPTELEDVELQAAIDAACTDLELNIEETGAVIEVNGEFPLVKASSSDMKQLFVNILSNALKFRRQGVVPKVTIEGSRLSGEMRARLQLPAGLDLYCINIADNGIGFEPEYADRIFQIFQRLNGKAEYPGSGIGLAICKKIVEKYNGFIFAEGRPDEGATFSVILPANQT